MRDLSAAAIEAIKTRLGTEPIVIVEIAWDPNNPDQRTAYADREVAPNVPGKILEVSAIDNVISLDLSEDTAELDLVLDDTDGSIKTIMDSNDIHKRDVWVYHWFEGMDLADKFLLMRGKISSPVAWNEGEQSVSFGVVTQLEDKEVGFSPEEGQFPFVPRDMVGVPWPSIFGTPLDVPAVQCNKAVTGTTLCPVGIISGINQHMDAPYGQNPPDVRKLQMSINHYNAVGTHWIGVDDAKVSEYREKSDEASSQRYWALENWARAQWCAEQQRQATVDEAVTQGEGCNPVRILGGEDFPHGVITLTINEAYFTGAFSTQAGKKDQFTISRRSYPPDTEEAERDVQDTGLPLWHGYLDICNPNSSPKPWTRVVMETSIPCQRAYFDTRTNTGIDEGGKSSKDSGDDPEPFSLPPGTPGGYQGVDTQGQCIERDVAYFGPRPEPENPPRKDVLKHFWADAGASVSITGDEPITYIVSIVPGTVLQVKAFKDFHGLKVLTYVPSHLYTVKHVNYGPIHTVQIVVAKALSTISDQGWGDDLYVTFRSDVGPNICDILQYLITTYSDMAYDSVSFDAVALKLERFPANFAILDRTNIIQVLHEIAFQARCSLRLIDGVFYISYLAEEPDAVDTIVEKDIEFDSISVELTSTENLVTKYMVNWRVSYAQPELNQLILRLNVKKYGIQEEEIEYYIYNQPDIIHKIATFWLIRKANSWKRIKFKTFLQKLNLEAFDAVLLDFQTPYIANTAVKGILELADLDTGNQTMEMECWLPVKSGEMEAYDFAWPANVPSEWIFPTQSEIDLGLAGGDGIGANATGDLPVGYYASLNQSGLVYYGGPNQGMGPQSDRGDPHPSDIGFTPAPVYVNTSNGEVDSSVNPNPWLGMTIMEAITDPVVEIPTVSDDVIYLDSTLVKLGRNDNSQASWTLENIILVPTESKENGGKLAIAADARVQSEHFDDGYGHLDDTIILVPKEDTEDGEATKQVCISADAHVSGPEEDEDRPNKPMDFEYDDEGTLWGCGTCFLQD